MVSIGRIMNLEDACKFWTQIQKAEKVMGPLSEKERLLILNTFGSEMTEEELTDLLKEKRTLVIRKKEETHE